MAKRRGLQGAPREHAQAFEHHIERAEDTVKQGNKATGCDAMYTAALQSSALSAIANHEARWAFPEGSFERKQADAKLDKLTKQAIKLDDKLRAKCFRP